MKTQKHIKDLQEGLKAMKLGERDERKKKLIESYVLVFEYVLNDKMTLIDLERAMRQAMR